MLHEQPLQSLHRYAGSRPGRAITEGHFAGIGKACFQRRTLLPVDDGDVVASFRQFVRGGDADDAGAKNDDFMILQIDGA